MPWTFYSNSAYWPTVVDVLAPCKPNSKRKEAKKSLVGTPKKLGGTRIRLQSHLAQTVIVSLLRDAHSNARG